MKRVQFILFVLLLVGCSSNEIALPTTNTNVLPSPSSSPSETIISPTQTFTPIPFPVFTSTPLWTPLPTFSSTTAEQTLKTWVQGAFDCLLPCWGGIIPGQTNWQEARQILEQLSGFSQINISENLSCEFGGCNGIAWSLYPSTIAEGAFYTTFPENAVHFIRISIQNEGNAQKINLLRNIGLQDVFRWYGLPPIFLLTVETDVAEDRFMRLILVYPERQSIIRYTKQTELTDNKVVNCGEDHQIEMIILDNKEQLASLATISNAVETRELHIDSRYKTVEEATGVTPNSFYDAVSASGEFCISTPIEMWTP